MAHPASSRQKRNPYEEEIDFGALALQSPEFNKFLKPNGQLDFSDPDAVRQLTRSLLKRDFGLEIDLPEDRLCPPVPNRLNYILWIQDLLDCTSGTYVDRYDAAREVVGLDIGTGASCIYPLLGCVQRPLWKFAATEIDEKNLAFARKNVIANKLKSKIRPVESNASGPLMPLDELGLDRLDFTMCNPPFYASTSELLAHAAEKSKPPYSACTGAEVEMVTPGGETDFVGRMLEESVSLGKRVQWYSSMLGKLSSVTVIVEKLRAKGVQNWAVKEFVQGGKTRRWGVAWSWGLCRPSLGTARGFGNLPKHLYAFPPEYSFLTAGSASSPEAVGQKIDGIIRNLDIKWQFRTALFTGVGFAAKNVWSRSARRQRQKKQGSVEGQKGQDEGDAMDEDSDDDEEPALVFKITVGSSPNSQDQHQGHGHPKQGTVEIGVRWLSGLDSVLFESFCGMLKRAVQN